MRRAFRGKLPHKHLRGYKHAVSAHLLVAVSTDDMVAPFDPSAGLLTVLITCLALGSVEAGLWRKHVEQPLFTSVPARVASKGQGTAWPQP